MGGDQPAAPQAPPAPPSPSETSAQAIQAQIDALPKMLAAQKEYGPQFSDLNLEQLKKYGPEFADQALALRDKISPEVSKASASLDAFLSGNDQQEFDALKPGLIEDVRAGQTARGIGDISPLGSIDEAVQIQRLKSSLKDRRLNVALSTAGRQPIGGVSNTNGTGQLVQNVSPGDIFGAQASNNSYNSSIFSSQANIFGTQSKAATERRAQNIALGSDIAGGAMQLGAAVAFCWTASELFGGMYEPKTVLSRIYVANYAPKWFRNVYIKYGKAFARFISDKPFIKNILRPVFDKFASISRRKLNG